MKKIMEVEQYLLIRRVHYTGTNPAFSRFSFRFEIQPFNVSDIETPPALPRPTLADKYLMITEKPPPGRTIMFRRYYNREVDQSLLNEVRLSIPAADRANPIVDRLFSRLMPVVGKGEMFGVISVGD